MYPPRTKNPSLDLKIKIHSLNNLVLTEGNLGKLLDLGILLLDEDLDDVLDGEEADDLAARLVDEGQVADGPAEHLVHAGLDGVIGRSGDEVGGRRHHLLDRGLLGFLPQEGKLGDVIALADDAGEVAWSTRTKYRSSVQVGGNPR